MLEEAPGFMRGMIKSGMRKGCPQREQDHSVVLTQDEKLWRSYFDVSDDKDPYVVLIDEAGKVLWHGHGAAASLNRNSGPRCIEAKAHGIIQIAAVKLCAWLEPHSECDAAAMGRNKKRFAFFPPEVGKEGTHEFGT